MVRAILDGRKTQTRRVVKRVKMHEDHGPPLWDRAWIDGQPNDQYLKVQYGTEKSHGAGGTVQRHYCPYGVPGDRLWVKETWRPFWHRYLCCSVQYAADSSYRKPEFDEEERGHRFSDLCETSGDNVEPWHPSIHMWREMSRITLEVVSVRVERVQELSEEEAISEGALTLPNRPSYADECRKRASAKPPLGDSPRQRFAALWEKINGAGSWESNPWVWVVAFKRLAAGGGV